MAPVGELRPQAVCAPQVGFPLGKQEKGKVPLGTL